MNLITRTKNSKEMGDVNFAEMYIDGSDASLRNESQNTSICLRVFLNINEGDNPPPLLVRSIQGVFRRYAVHKGSVRSTQKSCYIVRRHQFLLLRCPIFIKKHNKRDIQNQITLNIWRARFARAFWWSFQHL